MLDKHKPHASNKKLCVLFIPHCKSTVLFKLCTQWKIFLFPSASPSQIYSHTLKEKSARKVNICTSQHNISSITSIGVSSAALQLSLKGPKTEKSAGVTNFTVFYGTYNTYKGGSQMNCESISLHLCIDELTEQ